MSLLDVTVRTDTKPGFGVVSGVKGCSPPGCCVRCGLPVQACDCLVSYGSYGL